MKYVVCDTCGKTIAEACAVRDSGFVFCSARYYGYHTGII